MKSAAARLATVPYAFRFIIMHDNRPGKEIMIFFQKSKLCFLVDCEVKELVIFLLYQKQKNKKNAKT